MMWQRSYVAGKTYNIYYLAPMLCFERIHIDTDRGISPQACLFQNNANQELKKRRF